MYTLFRLPFILLELALRGGAETLKELLRLAAGAPRRDARASSPDRARQRAEAFAQREAAARPEPRPRRPTPVRRPEPPEPEAERLGERPAHISSGAEEVASFGPADDPSAQVEVEPPWPGYAEQPAAAIVARVRAADEATKAVVLMYERRHKKRRTVLQAAGA
jgi:hypothetical protein